MLEFFKKISKSDLCFKEPNYMADGAQKEV